MNKKEVEKLVNERIEYEKETGLDKVPNEILDNYSKQEIRKCIMWLMWHKKRLKGKDIKQEMLNYLKEHHNDDWRNKLIT